MNNASISRKREKRKLERRRNEGLCALKIAFDGRDALVLEESVGLDELSFGNGYDSDSCIGDELCIYQRKRQSSCP
jgi:hypothetical protein